MEKKEVINFGNLEHYIRKIEEMFQVEEINTVEQSLILNQTLQRLNKKQKSQQASDMMQNIKLGGLVKRIFKAKDEEEK